MMVTGAPTAFSAPSSLIACHRDLSHGSKMPIFLQAEEALPLPPSLLSTSLRGEQPWKLRAGG
jgi:hypothetical protein